MQDAKKVVETWSSEFSRTKDVSKRLAMIYLANDILQNSRKKGAQFVVEFYHKLPAAIQHLVKQGDGKVLITLPPSCFPSLYGINYQFKHCRQLCIGA